MSGELLPGQTVSVRGDDGRMPPTATGVVVTLLPPDDGTNWRHLVLVAPDDETGIYLRDELEPVGPAPDTYPPDISLRLLTEFETGPEALAFGARFLPSLKEANLERIQLETAPHPHGPRQWDLEIAVWLTDNSEGSFREFFSELDPELDIEVDPWGATASDYTPKTLPGVRQIEASFSRWPWRALGEGTLGASRS